jgi:hypothetical protein
MSVSHLLPGRPAKFGGATAAQITSHYRSFAWIHGAQLGLSAAVIEDALEKSKAAQAARFSGLAAAPTQAGVAAAIGDLGRCLNGDGSPKGELLNP